MRIRAATVADLPQMARVYVDGWHSAYRGIIPDAVLAALSYQRREQIWRGRMTGPPHGSYFYVAEDDGTIVGIAIGTERSGEPIYSGAVHALYIVPSHHRRGIGRQLMTAAADHLARAGITALSLGVFKGNPVLGFYQALGGTLIGEHTVDIATFLPELSGPVLVEETRVGWLDTRPLRAPD